MGNPITDWSGVQLKKSGLTRRTVRPLSVRTTGGNRTRDLWHRQSIALSTELQRYAERKLLCFTNFIQVFADPVDKYGGNLYEVRASQDRATRLRPRQKWWGLFPFVAGSLGEKSFKRRLLI